jgi:hypothetical protein
MPNTPKTNIASLVNKDTLNNLKDSGAVKAFGDQLKDQAKQKLIQAATDSPLTKLYKEKANLIVQEKKLDINHQLSLSKFDSQHKLYQKLAKAGKNTSNTNVNDQTANDNASRFQSYGKQEYVSRSDVHYVTDKSWKEQNPDSIHGIRQCREKDSGDCDLVWDGYKHIYVSRFLWEQKFKTPLPETVNGKDNTDINPPPPPPKPSTGLSDEEYQKAVDNENKSYNDAKKSIKEARDKNQKDIDDFKKDVKKKIKDEKKKIKDRLKKRKNRVKGARKKALKKAAKQIFNNNKAAIGAILAVILTNQLAGIIANNGEIGRLVDNTNAIIEDANATGDPTKLANAQIARDNALRIIQANEDRINQIKNQLQTIATFVAIFDIIISILSAIPIPVSFPPGVGIPMNVIILVSKILEYANKIVLSLSALLPIIIGTLEQSIDILEDYKSQLLDINSQLENSAAGGNSSLLNNGVDGAGGGGAEGGGIKVGPLDTTYKGFKFAIREEMNNPKFVVHGFKRHYAVAINKSNVEVVKSEYSFTLDPDDLVSQLKLVIDQQNLQA